MRKSRTSAFLLAVLLVAPAQLLGDDPAPEKLYYGVELNGSLVGYMEAEIRPADKDRKKEIEVRLFTKLTLLGQDFDTKMFEKYQFDPETNKVCYSDRDIDQGTMKMGSTVVFEGDEAHYTPKTGGGQPKVVKLDPDVIVDGPLTFPYIIKDLGPNAKAGDKKKYRVFDDMTGDIQEVTYTRKEMENVMLAGQEYKCLVVSAMNHSTGASADLWLRPEDGLFLKAELPNGGYIYRAAPAVVGKIKRAEVDDLIFAKVDVSIADYQAISYMKVKAQIRTIGEPVTVDSLNVPGQKFTGTVMDNFVDGVFEIEHRRYDGSKAPAFPADFASEEKLKEYLEPEDLIESDDSILIDKARELTKGASDCWEAVRRLSKWVAEEVAYEIPGGSARHTFDSKKGECGSHSRLLTAFCRAVGIPARLATGSMYTPMYGGSFGQHAWNEVYMGEAGWITVDSTAMETDYVDSGHVRLGTEAGFNPVEMEVLDFKAGALQMDKPAEGLGSFAKMPWQIGETYSYEYVYNGAPLGTDSFTVKSYDQADARKVYTCTSKLELQHTTATSEWQLDDQGRPLAYTLEGKAPSFEYSISCAFSEKQVTETVIKGGQPIERTVDLPERIYLIDNNNLSLFAFLLAAVPREAGKTFACQVFHPSSMQLMPFQVTVGAKEEIDIHAEKSMCWPFKVSLAGHPLNMWVDDNGRLVKNVEQGGALVVELVDSPKPVPDEGNSKTETQ